MQQKQHLFGLNRYTIGLAILLLLAIASSIAIILLPGKETDATTTKQTPIATTVTSEFSFKGATNWRQGPSNKTSMALFYNVHDCFIGVEHKAGAVEIARELQKITEMRTADGDVATALPAAQPTIQTKDGAQQYELHQYAVTGADGGASETYSAQAFGYLPMASGYLEVEAYCDGTEYLPAILPALEAITFQSDGVDKR